MDLTKIVTLRFTEQNEPLQYSKIAHGPGSHGFFWETHMEFLGLFAVTKCAELWLMVWLI
jgi:hypothetical protein